MALAKPVPGKSAPSTKNTTIRGGKPSGGASPHAGPQTYGVRSPLGAPNPKRPR